MSTRSYICIEENDGTYKGIYCHSDGYLTYNGAMLIDHYNTRERVNALISLGNLSSLGISINPNPYSEHSFDNRQENVCVFYARDRGEKGQISQRVELKDLDSPESWIEYCYIFTKDNEWKYFECGLLKEGIKDLKEGLNREYKTLGFERPYDYYGFFTAEDIRQYRYKMEKKQIANEA